MSGVKLSPPAGKTMQAFTKMKLIVRMHYAESVLVTIFSFSGPTARRQVHYFSFQADTFPACWAVSLPSERRLKNNHEVGGSCRIS